VALHVTLQDEGERDQRRAREQNGIDPGRDGDRARPLAQPLLDILHVGAERPADYGARHVESAHHAMDLGVVLAQLVGELEGPQQQGACCRQTMRQQPPLERLVMLPNRMVGLDQKTLVVLQDVQQHE
jgi:hypothetical protein